MRLRPNHAIFVAILALLLLGGTGCKSIWASITSPSDSISGSVNSISGSSNAFFEGISQSCSGTKPNRGDLAYGDDVRVLVRSRVAAGEPGEELLRAIGPVAAQHGITDWEAELATYHGLGLGLGQEGFGPDEARAYLARAGLTNEDALRHVEEGRAVVTE